MYTIIPITMYTQHVTVEPRHAENHTISFFWKKHEPRQEREQQTYKKTLAESTS